jgi:biopolymer transport protein ExbD
MSLLAARAYAAEPRADINVTPLIDVLLALVVVLMIAMPVLTKRIALPLAGSSNETSAPAEPIRLDVGADGALTWNESPLAAGMLREMLRVASRRTPQPEIRIGVSPNAPYQTFASVLADTKAADIARISVLDARASR